MPDIQILNQDCDDDEGKRGKRGKRGHRGPVGPEGPSRLIAAAHVRGTDGALLSSFGFSSSVRTSPGQYQLTLSSPPAATVDVIPVASLEDFIGFINVAPLAGGVVGVGTFSPVSAPTDVNFFVYVVDGTP
jgi:hypothetical protein